MNDFSIFRNDPLNRLLSKLGLINKEGRPKVFLCILFIVSITWLVPAILAYFQGIAVGSSPSNSYLLDFAAYAQFVVTLPLLIIAEPYVDREIECGINYLLSSHLLHQDDREILESELRKASKAQKHFLPSLFVFCLAFGFGIIYIWGELHNGAQNWHSFMPVNWLPGQFEIPSWAGLWNALISQPISTFYIFRWVWKLAVWYWLLWKISRKKIIIQATHPDQYGGLEFLARIQSKFYMLILATGLDAAVTNLYKIFIEGQKMRISEPTGLATVVFVFAAPMVFLGPLLLFQKALSIAKKESLEKYSALATIYSLKINELITNQYQLLSINKQKPSDEKSLQDSKRIKDAIEYLTSISKYYEEINKMHTLPLDFRKTGRLFISAMSALIPLIIQSPWFIALFDFIKTPK